jgi:hypothetical protein
VQHPIAPILGRHRKGLIQKAGAAGEFWGIGFQGFLGNSLLKLSFKIKLFFIFYNLLFVNAMRTYRRNRRRRRYRTGNPQKPITQAPEDIVKITTTKTYRLKNLASNPDNAFRYDDIRIAWQQPLGAFATIAVAFDSPTSVASTQVNSNRFVQIHDNYREYAITGFSIEFIPSGTVIASAGDRYSSITNIWWWSDPKIDTGGYISEAAVLQKENLQKRDPRKRFYQYFNCRSFSAAQ